MKPHSTLAICHFAFLAAVALYVGAFYPACRTLAVLLVLAGAVVEFLPRIFQKPLVPELLLAVALAGTWWNWPPSATTGDTARAAGMVAAYLLLIPSRIALAGALRSMGIAGAKPASGRLKWLLGLVILELIFGTRLPGTEVAAVIAIAIGLAALALDSWLAGSIAARAGDPAKPNVGVSLLRWAILPVLLVIAGANMIGTRVVEATAGYHVAQRAARTSQAGEAPELIRLSDNMSLGDHRSLELNPRIVARLTWENGAAPSGMVYLRGLTLPDLVVTGPAISWIARPQGDRRTPPAISAPDRWAQVQRAAITSDVVLRPDEDGAVEVPELSSDDTGNLFSAALRNREYTYRVGFDDRPMKADPAQLQRCLELDPRLDAFPWYRFEDLRWRLMPPEHAATLVCSRLQDFCRYDLKDLPLPMDGPGGVLRGFLFGATAEARRGHCQYFATAAVVLLRRAGHPARCVGGFASNEIDAHGVTFRELHLHAWIEVVNSRGEWERFDPSPDSRIGQALAGATRSPAKEQSTKPSGTENTEGSPAQVRRWLGQAAPALWTVLLGGLAILSVLRCRRWFSRASRPRDPRLMELQRRNDDLIKVAQSLGVVVTPATTLSDLVAALEARTQLSLDAHLRAHLAARFGQGPLPDPWPLEALAKARKAASDRPPTINLPQL